MTEIRNRNIRGSNGVLQTFVVSLLVPLIFVSSVVADANPAESNLWRDETLRSLLRETSPFSFTQWTSALQTGDLSVVVDSGKGSEVFPGPDADDALPLPSESTNKSTTASTTELRDPSLPTFEVVPRSIQWVRVGGLTLPRAKLRITLPVPPAPANADTANPSAPAVRSGKLRRTRVPDRRGSISGFGTYRELHAGPNTLLIPVLSSPDAALVLELPDGSRKKVWMRIDHRFERVIDPTCHFARPRLENLPPAGFLSIGCRTILTQEEGLVVPLVEVESASSLEKPGHLFESHTLSTDSGSFHLGEGVAGAPDPVFIAQVPARVRSFSLGVGIGPYHYRADDGAESVRQWVPLPTLYVSYRLRDTMRLVSFGAVAPTSSWNVDYGLYLWIEQFRGIDERVSLNLLIGARTLLFRAQAATYARFSVPQGLEVVWREFLVPRHALTVGAFLYPKTDSRAYTNLWLRFGRAGMFGELNYIHWYEAIEHGPAFRTTALGVSVGFPLVTP